MKKSVCLSMTVLAALFVSAMPTKQELSKARSIVQELMAPVMNGYQEKTKTAVEVANAATEFAKMANEEAMKYIFLRGAVSYYVRSGEFGKAADAVEQLKSNIKGVPPSDIVEVISSALGRDNALKAPRLNSQLQLAQAQVRAAKDLNGLKMQLKQVRIDSDQRQYAEALALIGDWKNALAEFSKVSGNVGKMAKADAAGTANALTLGDFWWNYETSYAGGYLIFRERAAACYRKAIAGGKIDGLKKTLVEQRLVSLTLPDVDNSVVVNAGVKGSANDRPSAARSSTAKVRARAVAAKNSSGLLHRWSFTDGLQDSVGGAAPLKSDNAKVENGCAALQSGSPLVFAAGTVPRAPFTVQVWASATDKGLGSEGDYIFKIAPSFDNKDTAVYWTWTRRGKRWVSEIGVFESTKSVGYGKMLVDGKKHLYTLTAEKAGGDMTLKFYQGDTIFGELKAPKSWKKPPQLILGGFVAPTYDEVRVYSRALTHAEIITSANEGADKVPEFGK